jgi:hypothetical protein
MGKKCQVKVRVIGVRFQLNLKWYSAAISVGSLHEVMECLKYGRFVDTPKKQASACFFGSKVLTYSFINQRPLNI